MYGLVGFGDGFIPSREGKEQVCGWGAILTF